jgi:transcriptional regulator with XRE-family HTH domain
MVIGRKLRRFREERNLSQGDIEKRAGLLRYYVSRVENGHTIPSVATLERWAKALELPLYELFWEGNEPPLPAGEPIPTEEQAKEQRFQERLFRLLVGINDQDRLLLLAMVRKLAQR